MLKSAKIFEYYNLENIIDIYDEMKELYQQHRGIFNDDNSSNFVKLILSNMIENNSDDHSVNYYEDV